MINNEITVIASTTKSATFNSDEQDNNEYKGIRLSLNISAMSGTSPTLDIKLQHKDPVSGTWIDITGAAFAQKTSTGTDDLVIYPGITSTANRRVSDALPRKWRAVCTIGGTTPSVTFSLGGSYIP
jgi:hypothetical protein